MAEGRVSWKGGRFVAEIQDRQLKAVLSDTINLAPGAYRFYFLPGSGGLLSAEALGLADQAAPRQEMNQILAQANHFDPSALEVNRAGRMAPGQRRRLLNSLWIYLVAEIVIAAFAFGFIQPLLPNLNDPGTLIFPALILLAIVGAGLIVLWRALLVVVDAASGQVLAQQGTVYKSVRRGRTITYYYTMEGRNWMVSRQAYNALVDGGIYRAYYTPRSKALVAIESVESD